MIIRTTDHVTSAKQSRYLVKQSNLRYVENLHQVSFGLIIQFKV